MPKQNMQTPYQKVDMKKALLRLAKYLKSYSPIIIISLILFIANTVFVIIGPNKISEITDILQKALPIFGKNGTIDIGIGKVFDLQYLVLVFEQS